jgi:hypothetical protein
MGARHESGIAGSLVGQDGILRRVGNPPLCGVGCVSLGPFRHQKAECTRPQDAILPY